MRKRFMAYVPGTTPTPPVTDTTPPTVPTGLSATSITSTGFRVTWNPSTDAVGVTGYTVQVNGVTYGTTPGTFLDITGRAPSTSYSVRVSAQDAAGNTSAFSSASSFSTTASAAASIFTTQTPTTTDAADGQAINLATRFTSDADGNVTGVRFYRAATSPTSVIGLLYSDAGVELARATFGTLTTGWNSVTFATPVPITAGIYYRAAYWSSGPYVATSGFFTNPLTTGNLTATAGYYDYSPTPVMANSTFGAGGYFADVLFAATAAPVAPTVPADPAAPTLTAGDGSIFVTWAAPDNGGSPITAYDVQPFAGATGGTVVTVGNVTSTTLTGLTNGQAYTVKVLARNAVGDSGYSPASAPATPTPPPPTPDTYTDAYSDAY